MNVDTNHVMRIDEGTQSPEGYITLPEELNRAGRRALKGQKEVTISRTSGGKLSRWAAKQRKLRTGGKRYR